VDGLMRLKTGDLAPLDATVKVVSGVIEHSNVNAVAELVDLIKNATQFEVNVKLMQTAKQNYESSSKLLLSS